MAITAVNASYRTQGPTGSGQILADNSSSSSEVALVYTGLVTLDGTSTTFTLNFIDGTKTLSFTPTAVTADVVGGTQVATSTVNVSTTTPTTTGVTVNLSAAGTSGNTILIAGFILK
jgi:hypothetical protein